MKANQKSLKNAMNDRAEVGVGTLIVFIAMVLVAAVAAAVLINTSGTLQQRASQTGKDATQDVSSNLKVEGIYGNRTASSGNIETVSIHLALQAGAVPVDLNEMVVRYSDGTTVREMRYLNDDAAEVAHDTTKFGLESLRDEDSSFTAGSPVITAGDLVKLSIYKVDLGPRTTVNINLIPEAGAQIPADFQTPTTFGTGKVVVLR